MNPKVYIETTIMTDDPIVAEVRKARDDYAQRFHYDLDAICQDLQQKQQQSGRKLVSFPPKRPKNFDRQAVSVR